MACTPTCINVNMIVCNGCSCKRKVESSDLTSAAINHTSNTASAIIKLLPLRSSLITWALKERNGAVILKSISFHYIVILNVSLFLRSLDHQILLFFSILLPLIVLSSLHVQKKKSNMMKLLFHCDKNRALLNTVHTKAVLEAIMTGYYSG